MSQLYGENIRLRATEKTDLDTFCHWINDPEITENLSLIFPMSRVSEEHWYEKMLVKPAAEHVMVIEIFDDKTHLGGWQTIGNCGFMNFDWRSRSAEIGIMIGEKQYWNMGYGTKTMHILLKHGFETLNLHRIWLQVIEKNQAGIRCYKKAGFVHEGTFRKAHFQHGEYYDFLLMSILKDEWQESNAIKDKN